ncbi:glycoside hydrolase family 13 protein [Lachnoclostridium sp. An181]|uniref:glycoside hydrolase family 13 protein n=1 Tax=Lachnoclostridium sp. An181 TaxID=1965575 RepID=UPI000B39BA51|nr:alpha-glucosidase [Lachnoclostridium sp. An181]OUP49086.1 glucohydrolase [Lachnoclostridium sp. An181]
MKKKWWNEKIVYQVYPRSFKDTNGDGIGDVRGIIEKLDYIKSVGVDMIWISPIYKSPMKDNGYDISDYYAIDPIFGTMEDMDELLLKAKQKGLKVLMDLVVNHCSSEHEWFKKALKDPKGPYGDYFIIKEGKDGKAPNNWRSIFGGSVWEPIKGTPYYYYHTFAKEQPDLNWENPQLRREIYDMMNWWLKKGLGGFRVDAITYIKKDPSYKSLPADGADGLAALSEVSSNYPGIEVFLKEMREETFDVYDAFSVAEMSGVDAAKLREYIGPDGLFSSIFDFSYMELDVELFQWYRPVEVNATMVKEKLFESQSMAQEAESFLSVVLENHDQPRAAEKWFPKQVGYESQTMLATMNLMLRGIPFIYQGEEIGMTNSTFSDIREYEDIMLWGQYDRAKKEGCTEEECLDMANRRSRDHARTPMQWDDSEQAGFTTGKPALPVNDNYRTINVKKEEREGSVLDYYRKLTALRKSDEYRELLTYGEIYPALEEEKDVIAYERVRDGKKLLIVLNFLGENQKISLGNEERKIVLSNYKTEESCFGQVELQPFQALVLA